MKRLGIIMLAAGQGTRMRSKLAKVLHSVAGRPMILYGLELAQALTKGGTGNIAVVIGHQAEQVKDRIASYDVVPVVQARQLGTGHAVLQAQAVFQRSDEWRKRRFVILSGDTPLLTEATLRALLAYHEEERATATVLTAHVERPAGYGRIVRSRDGSIYRIIEDKDASSSEKRINEINAGTYVVEGDFLFPALTLLKPANAQKEYYLPDIVSIAVQQGKRVAAFPGPHAVETLGINTRQDLAEAERLMRARIRERHMAAGVTFLAPETSFVDADVRIGRDTVIYPHTALEGRTVLGEDCVIRSHSRVTESALGDRVTVLDACVIEGARLEEDTMVGPFARLRAGTILRRAAKVGNFVELKKAELDVGAKANHLTYIGDAEIGKRVNIGAGTITCNYDGVSKHGTVIGDDVFVGSDVSFVAPVKIGKGAIIGAGSVVTEDVPPDALALGRARQVVKPGRGKVMRERQKSSKGKH